MLAGIDVGYGFTKIVSGSGRSGSFPSVVAMPHGKGDLTAVLGGKTLKHRLSVTIGGKTEEYLVGQAALASGASRTWDTSASDRNGYDILVLTALALVKADEDVSLALGLPLSVYANREERKALRARLKGLSAKVKIDGQHAHNITVTSVAVYPQALGAYFASLDSPDGERLAGQAVGVLDIGFRTTDYMLLTPTHEGVSVPDEARSGSVDAGIGQVIDSVRGAVAEQTGVAFLPPEGIIESAILNGGTIVVRGQEIDIRPAYQKALQALVTRIESDLRRAWGDNIDYLASVLVAGGGGKAVKPLLRLPGARLAQDAVFANARGFAGLLVAQVLKEARPLV